MHGNKGRGCPTCGILSARNKNVDMLRTIWLGKKHTTNTRLKMKRSQVGNKHPMYNKSHSDKSRLKIRLGCISALKAKGIFPGSGMKKTYNPSACKFIDNLNTMLGLNLQHALTGGEVELYGYFVDGYDRERNIIFEYDESRHYTTDGQLTHKDKKRQADLISHIHPSLFMRYSELHNNLYDAETNASIQTI